MATIDRRNEGGKYPIARKEFATQTFPATATAALAPTLANLNGTIKAMEIIISETEDNITYTVALATSEGTALFSEAAIADASDNWRDAISLKATRDADFNPIPVCDTITCTITPSAKPDASAVGTKIATVAVKLYME